MARLRVGLAGISVIAGLIVALGVPTASFADAAPSPSPSPSAPAPTPSPTATATPSPSPTPTPTPTPPVPTPVASHLSATWSSTASSRRLTLTGLNLDSVTGVVFGQVVATDLVIQSDTSITFTIGTAYDFQPGRVNVYLQQDGDAPILTRLTYVYRIRNAVDREMKFAFQNWNKHGTSRFIYIPHNDCADFASQVILARGWRMNSAWYNRGGWNVSASWVSSTHLMKYIQTHPRLGRALNDSQRSLVKIGDIVQFDWHRAGDRDHTAIVSKIVTEADGHIDIFYVAHTNHTQYGSVDWSINVVHPGAAVYYWSLN